MSLIMRCGVSLLLICLTVSAIGQQPNSRIINGVPTDEFAAVGILGDELGGFCTATLVSPRHILTSAHSALLLDSPAAGLFEIEGEFYATRAIHIHPNFNPASYENDIAVIELAEEVEGVAPAVLFRTEPVEGDLLTIVGFGVGGTASGGASGAFGTKRYGVTTIDEIDDLFVYWTYDDPGQSNSAPGDSGGPGFIELGGEFYLAAVISGGSKPDASLGDQAFNTRVDTQVAWIDPIIAPDEQPTDEEPTDEEPTDEEPTDEEPTDEEPSEEEESCVALDNLRQAFWDFVETLPIVQFIKEIGVELGWWTLNETADE